MSKTASYWRGVKRQSDLVIVSLVAVVLLAFTSMALDALLLKFVTVVSFGVLGYYLDRAATPYARPGDMMLKLAGAPESERMAWALVVASSMLRRALIMVASICGAAMVIT